MRTRTLLSVTLLGLLLWASCTRADDTESKDETSKETPEETTEDLGDDDAEEEEEEVPKKPKTTEIEEENDVMVLHINNFDRALSENKYLLVEFYAPWCGFCKQIEPIYSEAAGKGKKENMRLAKVDSIEEKELTEEFDIQRYPTLKMFINGDRKQPFRYTGGRSADDIIQWMKRRISPGATVLDSTSSAAQFIGSHNITIVGFFKDLESKAAKVLDDMYFSKTNLEFAKVSSPEVFQKYEVKSDSVVLFKNFDEGRADFALTDEVKLDEDTLSTFINDNTLPLIIKFSEETSKPIFKSSVRIHMLLFVNSSVDAHAALLEETRDIAKDVKGKMLFIQIDVTEVAPSVLQYFGLSQSDAPTARVVDMNTRKKYNLQTPDPITAASVRQLCEAVQSGSAQPYYLSESIPEDWDKEPVKVLVGKNFNSVALDPSKNVFVKLYAPWCEHCKDLAPIWEKLGEKYAEHQDIVIAKMDSTVNEVEGLDVGMFPMLKYYPAGGKEGVEYQGEKTLEKLSEFLDSGGVQPELTDEDDEDDEDEEEVSDETKDSAASTESSTNSTAKDEL